jgi:hypothetical protein
MAGKKQQTHAKKARELAVKEKRERKRVKKAERAAGIYPEPADNGDEPGVEGHTEVAEPEWIA